MPQPHLTILLRQDAFRLGATKAHAFTYLRLWWTSSSFRAVVLARFAALAPGGLGRMLASYNLRSTGADIDPRASIGPGLLLQHPVGVVIGGGCVVGANVTLMSNVVLGRRRPAQATGNDGYPKVGAGVFIGTGSAVLGDIRLGDGSSIGAHSLVLADVPSLGTAIGSPARLIASDPQSEQ